MGLGGSLVFVAAVLAAVSASSLCPGIHRRVVGPGRALRLSVLLLLLMRAPRALEGGPSERQNLLGVGREDPERGQRTVGGRRGSCQCSMVCDPSMHSGHIGLAVGPKK